MKVTGEEELEGHSAGWRPRCGGTYHLSWDELWSEGGASFLRALVESWNNLCCRLSIKATSVEKCSLVTTAA